MFTSFQRHSLNRLFRKACTLSFQHPIYPLSDHSIYSLFDPLFCPLFDRPVSRPVSRPIGRLSDHLVYLLSGPLFNLLFAHLFSRLFDHPKHPCLSSLDHSFFLVVALHHPRKKIHCFSIPQVCFSHPWINFYPTTHLNLQTPPLPPSLSSSISYLSNPVLDRHPSSSVAFRAPQYYQCYPSSPQTHHYSPLVDAIALFGFQDGHYSLVSPCSQILVRQSFVSFYLSHSLTPHHLPANNWSCSHSPQSLCLTPPISIALVSICSEIDATPASPCLTYPLLAVSQNC